MRDPFRPGGTLNAQWAAKVEPAHSRNRSSGMQDREDHDSIYDKLYHQRKVKSMGPTNSSSSNYCTV